MVEDGNSVLLESHKFPRWYLAVGIGGEVVDPKTLVPGSREAHFGVRAEVGHYKYIETTMYSSIAYCLCWSSVSQHSYKKKASIYNSVVGVD